MLPSGHVPDAQGLGYPAGEIHASENPAPVHAKPITDKAANARAIRQWQSQPQSSFVSHTRRTGDCRQKRRLSAAGHEPSAARQDAKKFITKRPRLPAAAPKKISNLFEHLQHDDPKLVSISADSTSSPSPSSASSSELPLLQRPETRRMSRERFSALLPDLPGYRWDGPVQHQTIRGRGQNTMYGCLITPHGSFDVSVQDHLLDIPQVASMITARIRCESRPSFSWQDSKRSTHIMNSSAYHWAQDDHNGPIPEQAVIFICADQAGALSSSGSRCAAAYQLVSPGNTQPFKDHVVGCNSSKTRTNLRTTWRAPLLELLGTDARQAPVDAQGLPDRMEGAAEEYQQRSFLKLLLESVLESRSPVLNYTALLETYASLSGQAHKREIQNLRRLMSCLEGSGIIKRTDLSQQKGRDAVARSARWTLTSIKPIVAVIDTFAAAVKPPPADNPALPPDEPLFLSRSDLRPFAQEASVLQLHQLAQRAIATPDLPDGAIGGDGKKAPREKGCSRHRSIPCAHSIGLHHHLQDPKLWDIEDPVAESFGRHSIQMCDTCAHFLKNNGHPPLVPVDGFGTSCPLGRKFKLPESASQIQELVDVLVMPGTPASNRRSAHEFTPMGHPEYPAGDQSILRASGQTEPAAIDAASETGSAPQDEVEETKEHHRMEAVQDLHAEGWDIGELTQPFEKVREGLATHTEQPRDVEESPKQIEKQMSLCDAVIILLQAAIAEMPEDRLLGCALDTISCLTDYVSQKKTSTAHACSVLKAKLHALRQLADIIPTLSDPICATCTLRPVNKMLSPCGHTLCTPCATRMRDTSPSCWFCRRPVHGENDIFFS
ncbi:hypothetical protein WJX84_010410 [Apatococcus fuscideae]|uniref:RING-type domain-containing protein n=1 Tax=Apatococcus fuscideae TaxID=2026836 RepID=A0AAW1T155_9CHLO